MAHFKFIIISFFLLSSVIADDKASAQSIENRFQKIIQKTFPYIVQVRAENQEEGDFVSSNKNKNFSVAPAAKFFLPNKKKVSPVGLGSGFMVEPRGTIVTNYHVVQNANRFKVILSNQIETEGKVIGFDSELDIAIIKIDAKYCTPIKWANSSELKTGSIVFAFGSPFGLQNSVSKGIISAVGREGWQSDNPQYIQTDTAINTGNSGGPLVNLRGQAVGINTWILSPAGVNSGVGFALPSNLAKIAIKNILSGNHKEAWLGVIPHIKKDNTAGVKVLGVIPGSPAEKAGILAGDVLTHYDQYHLDSYLILKALLADGLKSRSTTRLKKVNSAYTISSGLGLRDNLFDFALMDKESGSEDYSVEQKKTVFKQLSCSRKCSLHERVSIKDCDNCTAAKTELSRLIRLLEEGYGSDQIERALDAPISIVIWADLTSEKSKEVCSLVESVRLRFGLLVNVEIRHYPVTSETIEPWKQFVNSYEALRVFGRENNFYHKLIANPKRESCEVLAEYLNENKNLEKAVQEASVDNMFQEQILNDVKEGPFKFGIRRAPGLTINDECYLGEYTEVDLIQKIKFLLMQKSF